MTSTVIDTNVILDILGPEDVFQSWSVRRLAASASEGVLIINPIVVSELAPALSKSSLKAMLMKMMIGRENINFDAAHAAGVAHAAYRKAGGRRERTLPDFLIGAHASVSGHRLLTRDPARYRSHFPEIEIIAPDTHP
ncbi:MAG: type II toxin-antitoxin system VapC family toxin [Pseudomonadota bacterium]